MFLPPVQKSGRREKCRSSIDYNLLRTPKMQVKITWQAAPTGRDRRRPAHFNRSDSLIAEVWAGIVIAEIAEVWAGGTPAVPGFASAMSLMRDRGRPARFSRSESLIAEIAEVWAGGTPAIERERQSPGFAC